jgi:hypothetical protein
MRVARFLAAVTPVDLGPHPDGGVGGLFGFAAGGPVGAVVGASALGGASAGLAGSLCDGDPTSEVIADTALGAPFGLAGAGLNAQRRESAERRVPLGGSLFRGAALEVPDDSLQAWPAASIAAVNGHGFLVREPLYEDGGRVEG